MNHMAGNRKKISLRTANAFAAIHAQQTQEHLLGKVGDVRRIAQPHGQEAAQAGPIPGRDTRDEAAIVRFTHTQPLGQDSPKGIRALSMGKWVCGAL